MAVACYLSAEAVTAAAYPGYSYATNYISDLGVPGVGSFQGRAVDSPLHAVMNTAFVLHGVLFVTAAVLVARGAAVGAAGPRLRRWFVGLAIVHGVGILLVGVFHGSQANADNGLMVLHVLGAGMAIVGGNAAVILAGAAFLRSPAHRLFGSVSVALGVIGLVSLVMLQVDSSSTAVDLLSDGVWERGAVYTIQVWEVTAAVATLMSLRCARRVAEARA
ncbi:DUF998 domain-containing protein [Streptomyces corynorhini]|uniref:DUF998 domain-containing protein n=1 Tax=Streptomyces corynorhini TaxID=2282652 RepID=UPI001F1B0319|nr:DUF998 domain-containing protein [Streptomyces corynorhini]